MSLFTEVHHRTYFSVNVYGSPQTPPSFDHLANLFAPATVDACCSNDGSGPVSGYKTADGELNTSGHRDRIILVNDEALAVFAALYDEPGTSARRARLPALHAVGLQRVAQKLSMVRRRLGDLGDDVFIKQPIGMSEMLRRMAPSAGAMARTGAFLAQLVTGWFLVHTLRWQRPSTSLRASYAQRMAITT